MNKFRILYNTPTGLHSFCDALLEMIKKEVDDVVCGAVQRKMSIYSGHDTTLMRMECDGMRSSPAECLGAFPACGSPQVRLADLFGGLGELV